MSKTHTAQRTTKKGSAKHRRESYYDLINEFRILIDIQQKLSGTEAEIKRLAVYDAMLPRLIDAALVIGTHINLTQAGGRPVHPLFNLAYRKAEDHYKKTGKVIRVKMLVKSVEDDLPDGIKQSDEEGNPAFSSSTASHVIKIFKICLPHEDFYRN